MCKRRQTWLLFWFKFWVKIYTLWLFEWHVWPWWLTRHQSRGKMVPRGTPWHPLSCSFSGNAPPSFLPPAYCQTDKSLNFKSWNTWTGWKQYTGLLTFSSAPLKQFFDGANGARALIFPGLLLSDEIIERKTMIFLLSEWIKVTITVVFPDKDHWCCSPQASAILETFCAAALASVPCLALVGGGVWQGCSWGRAWVNGHPCTLGQRWSPLHTWTKVQCILHTWTKVVTRAHLEVLFFFDRGRGRTPYIS